MTDKTELYKRPILVDVGLPEDGVFEIQRMEDGPDGLVVYLSDKSNGTITSIVSFGTVYAYRTADEGARCKYWESLGGYLPCGVFEAEETDFSVWARSECLTGELPREIKNFILVSPNDVIDILCFDQPSLFSVG